MDRQTPAAASAAPPENFAPSWTGGGLKPHYAVLAFDILPIRVREGAGARNASLLFCLAIDVDGGKDILGIWQAGSDWAAVIAELGGRGVQSAHMMIVDPSSDLRSMSALAGTPTHLNLPALIRLMSAGIERRRRKTLDNAVQEAMLAAGIGEADARMRRLPPTDFAPALEVWRQALPHLAGHFELPSGTKRFALKFDAAASLKEKLARRAVRLPLFWRSEHDALQETRAMLRHVGVGWKVAPRLWLQTGEFLRGVSPRQAKGTRRFLPGSLSTKGQPNSTYV